MTYAVPARDADSFTCPFCGLFSYQHWELFVVGYENKGSAGGMAWSGIGREAEGLAMSFCSNCGQAMVWRGDEPIWPATTSAPLASKHMPDDVRTDFEEARRVVDRSTRSAASLLRMSMQKLCRHLGRSGESLDEDIEALVKSGLPFTVRLALERVRVVGADAVPPGMLDVRDDRQTALALFDLVNAVVDKMIAEPTLWRTS
jgi:hypothetical protein